MTEVNSIISKGCHDSAFDGAGRSQLYPIATEDRE